MGVVYFSTTKWVSIDFNFVDPQYAKLVEELEAWIKSKKIRFGVKENHFWLFMPDDAAKISQWLKKHGAKRISLSTRLCKHCGQPQ
jgi:hypothetical protein